MKEAVLVEVGEIWGKFLFCRPTSFSTFHLLEFSSILQN